MKKQGSSLPPRRRLHGRWHSGRRGPNNHRGSVVVYGMVAFGVTATVLFGIQGYFLWTSSSSLQEGSDVEKSSIQRTDDTSCGSGSWWQGWFGRRPVDAASLWAQQGRERLVESSRHPDDPSFGHEAWTRTLLQAMEPRMPLTDFSVSPPSSALHTFRQKVQDRWMELETSSSSSGSLPSRGRPVHVVVVGGATTVGVGCDVASVKIPTASIMANPLYCAWPYRLEQFVNQLASAARVDQQLKGKRKGQAKSNTETQDPSSSSSSSSSKKSDSDPYTNALIRVVNMAEEGTETAVMTPLMRNRLFPIEPDLVIHAYDDDDRETEDAMTAFVDAVERSSCAWVIRLRLRSGGANTAKVPTLDVSDVVNRASSFDPHTTTAGIDIGIGMAGHVSVAWAVAYRLTQGLLSSSHCNPHTSTSTSTLASPECRSDDTPCALAWFAGPAGTVSRPSEVTHYLQPFWQNSASSSLLEDEGWKAATDMSAGYSRKTGLAASRPGATLQLVLPNLATEVRHLTLMVLRTPKYDGTVRVRVEVEIASQAQNDNVVRELDFDIEGDGDVRGDDPVTRPVEVDLTDEFAAPVGSTLRLRVEMVRGKAFKFLGMMFCP